jgi:CRP/FNR family cyclic AMP-dependent transcriptional regulator
MAPRRQAPAQWCVKHARRLPRRPSLLAALVRAGTMTARVRCKQLLRALAVCSGTNDMASNFKPLSPRTQHLGSATEFADDFYEAVCADRFFEQFTRAECNELCVYLDCYGVPSRAWILREGDAGNFMLIVLTGTVDIIKSAGTADEMALATLGPGALVGELSLVDGDRRYASCVARTPADFAVLTRDALDDLLMDNPRLGNKLLLLLLRANTAHWRDSASQAPISNFGPLV